MKLHPPTNSSVRTRRASSVMSATVLLMVAWGCESTTQVGPTDVEVPSGSILASSHRSDVTATYFFGASTSDAGNFAAVLPVPSPPYFDGRASNGPVWSEYFADLLGTNAEPSSMGGDNYAFGGARAGELSLGFILPMTAQVEQYLLEADGSADPRALHIVQAGGNDLFLALGQSPDEARRTMVDAAGYVRTMLLELRAAGARRFAVLTQQQLPTLPPPVLPDGTNLVDLFNDGLESVAADLNGRGVHVAVFDLKALVEKVIADPEGYGLTVADCSYMGKSSLDILGGDITPEPCDPDVPGNEYMMWDTEHFTTAMHEIVATALWRCHRYLRGAGNSPPVSRARCAEGRGQGLE